MSPNEDNPKAKKKKYLWLGYGSYSQLGGAGLLNPGNIRSDPGILDKLFEIFGVKEKPKKERHEDKE